MRKKRYELRKNSDFNKITECWAYSKAAATGLKCICSDTITEELVVIQGIIRLPLEKEEWKSTLKKQRLMPNENRMIAVEMIENCGFDLHSEVIRIEQKYRENLHEKDKEDLK